MSEIHSAEEETPEISVPAPEKRPRGRPPGSRNRVSREARELLAKGGHKTINALLRMSSGSAAAVSALHAIAEGQALPWSRENEPAYPTVSDMLAASRTILEAGEMVVSRLVPELRAKEISGPDGEPFFAQEDAPTTRDLSKAVLQILSRGVDGSRVTVESPDTYTARFSDKALGQRILGDSQMAASAFSEPAGTREPSDAANEPVPASESLKRQGDAFLIRANDPTSPFVRRGETLADGRTNYGVHACDGTLQRYFFSPEEAERWARQRIEARRL